MSIPISIQLYTLRDETEKDFIGTLEKVAAIGYKGVEFAGYGGLSAVELKNSLDRLGLKASGSHVPADLLISSLEEVLEYNIAIGNKYIICPWDKFESKEELLEKAAFYSRVAERCREKGLQFCYHNHDHEFAKIDGEYILDTIFNETDPDLVQAELDMYWVSYAGVNTVEYLRKYSGRCPLVHFKDMEDSEDRIYTEVGNGILDFNSIAQIAEKGGAQWFVVELDNCKRPSLESVAISFENLKKMNLV
jgi:sugar phosphate isomerase/epimerase